MSARIRAALTRGLTKWPLVGMSVLGVAGCVHVLIKTTIGGKKYTIEGVNLEGKTFIITGANGGIGFETAKKLAEKKARVIMACRNMDVCAEKRRDLVLHSRNKHVVCRKCDLNSMESVRKFAAKVIARENRVDALINNAAQMRVPGHNLTEDGFERQLGVNYLGHFLLTVLLLDKMKKQDFKSRIVHLGTMSSYNAEINFEDLNMDKAYDADKAYRQSKVASVAFSRQLGNMLKDSNVTSNVVEPGVFVRTKLERYMPYNRVWYSFVARPVMGVIRYFRCRNTEQAAWRVLHAVLDDSLEGVNGQYLRDYEATTDQVNEAAMSDDRLGLRLWATSEKWTRIKEQMQTLSEEVNTIIESDKKKAETSNL